MFLTLDFKQNFIQKFSLFQPSQIHVFSHFFMKLQQSNQLFNFVSRRLITTTKENIMTIILQTDSIILVKGQHTCIRSFQIRCLFGWRESTSIYTIFFKKWSLWIHGKIFVVLKNGICEKKIIYGEEKSIPRK